MWGENLLLAWWFLHSLMFSHDWKDVPATLYLIDTSAPGAPRGTSCMANQQHNLYSCLETKPSKANVSSQYVLCTHVIFMHPHHFHRYWRQVGWESQVLDQYKFPQNHYSPNVCKPRRIHLLPLSKMTKSLQITLDLLSCFCLPVLYACPPMLFIELISPK